TTGPNRSVIVNDQTKQPAQVWTHDGLYVGAVFEKRVADGRAPDFYRVHGDDNQGATIVTTNDGKTYWLMPYQGHNRLYQVSGWDNWKRQSGPISRRSPTDQSRAKGDGLTARYFQGAKLVLKTIEPPIYYQKFGSERHSKTVTPHYKVTWTGHVRGPLTDTFRFRSLLGRSEQVAVWLDGRIVHSNGFPGGHVNRPVKLTAGHRHRIRVEYINPEGRAELTLLWFSTVTDPQQIPTGLLDPETD
ncbi:MAG: hypothetical protein CMJ68_06760, partial [Planctomycetaceae bacterium]|nr:hypothetical protein [Planctomycetaceae bacterium]